jgi:hypothetical protein
LPTANVKRSGSTLKPPRSRGGMLKPLTRTAWITLHQYSSKSVASILLADRAAKSGSGFGDLPDDTCEKLWELHKHELAFPAGIRELLTGHGPKEYRGY